MPTVYPIECFPSLKQDMSFVINVPNNSNNIWYLFVLSLYADLFITFVLDELFHAMLYSEAENGFCQKEMLLHFVSL